MSATGASAIAWARAEITSTSKSWRNLCLQFTRSAFRVKAKYPSAIVAWSNAKKRHATDNADSIPAGVPVFWSIGQYGHVAISLGGGRCISTDILRRGKPDIVDIDTVTKRWGARLLGWSEDINDVTVYVPPKPVPKTVKYRVNTRVLPLNGRSGPGTKFKVVAKAKKGQTLTIDKVDGGWGRTSYGHWFKMSFLKKV
jgi:uncharacterized protein YgiM (DUF1202 family)